MVTTQRLGSFYLIKGSAMADNFTASSFVVFTSVRATSIFIPCSPRLSSCTILVGHRYRLFLAIAVSHDGVAHSSY